MSPKYTGLPEPRVGVVRDDVYELLEDFLYEWEKDGSSYRIVAHEGFRFDGASIPWAVQPIIGGRWALGLGPPCIHDLLYRSGGDFSANPHGTHEVQVGIVVAGAAVGSGLIAGPAALRWQDVGFQWSRSAADRLFGRHMREVGVARWRRRAAYRAVQLFGRGSWQG